MSEEKPEDLKAKGNECVKNGNFSEAILHYSHAIKMDPKNHLLYSNRSLAFLKLQQYYYAMEDAKECIKLKPTWPKGFYRKGEVEYNVGNYTLAQMAYKQAMMLDPTDEGIKDAIVRTTKEVNKVRKAEKQEPWKYAAGGVVVGIAVVLGDQFMAEKPVIEHIVLQILMVLAFLLLSLLLWKGFKLMRDWQSDNLLEPPIDLLKEFADEGSKHPEKSADDPTEDGYTSRRGGNKRAQSGKRKYKLGKSS
ncbi:small glutamine-rich tetratricopeptide repeat-containing protein alpha-like [Ylistrum balloti]|uniref:small glutamine-rich tetratricopeptide repeat-containing protein alpha-like n=1 Tax=Ylistrum balloti TaxID=509963 RepID=UPI002905BEE7|nr:small glutamine-rich tetratricopeptide repeat-containing protein alpha-like [Ylistrum balloti]